MLTYRICAWLSFFPIPLTLTLMLILGTAGCAKAPPKSRLEKRVCIYLGKMETSAVDLEHAVAAIADAKVTNTRERMRNAVNIVRQAEQKLTIADNEVRAYIAFTNVNKGALKAEGLSAYLVLREILGRPLMEKRKAMKAYFSATARWLSYCAAHFDALKKGDRRARQNYDQLLIEVNRNLKQYNLANEVYHRHTRQFADQHPGLKKKFNREYKVMKKEMGWF